MNKAGVLLIKTPNRRFSSPYLSFSLHLTLCPALSPFSFKKYFFIQVVLSHSQHQHLIKPKDKHGARSTAELISSPGSIGQLPSICPNTNLLFFTRGKKREHQNNAVGSMLLSQDIIMERSVNINYRDLSSLLLPLL